ncbi:MAG: methylglyoxal synthase [Nostocoides sp.]
MAEPGRNAVGGSMRIALVAHDNRKAELLRWAEFNVETLKCHDLCATGTTGTMLQFELGLPVTRLLSGPVGGDQQIGARIAEGLIDLLVFFWDPLESQPHDPDVKALLRVAAVWNTAVACNVASADLMISSPLMDSGYRPQRPDFGDRTATPEPASPGVSPRAAGRP